MCQYCTVFEEFVLLIYVERLVSDVAVVFERPSSKDFCATLTVLYHKINIRRHYSIDDDLSNSTPFVGRREDDVAQFFGHNPVSITNSKQPFRGRLCSLSPWKLFLRFFFLVIDQTVMLVMWWERAHFSCCMNVSQMTLLDSFGTHQFTRLVMLLGQTK